MDEKGRKREKRRGRQERYWGKEFTGIIGKEK